MIARDPFVSAIGASLPVGTRPAWAGLWDGYWWVFVKGWHATEFAILLLLVFRAVREIGWSLFLVLLAATLDEFHQTFVPGRGGIVSDVLIDAGGAIVAAALVYRKHRLKAGGSLGRCLLEGVTSINR